MSRKSQHLPLFAAFTAHAVDFVVVGGVAVNAHGLIRNTHDLDGLLRPSLENAQAAHAALASLGAPLEGIAPEDLLNDKEHFQLLTPHGSIDILTSIGEMPFEQVWRNRLQTTIDGVPAAFISRRISSPTNCRSGARLISPMQKNWNALTMETLTIPDDENE